MDADTNDSATPDGSVEAIAARIEAIDEPAAEAVEEPTDEAREEIEEVEAEEAVDDAESEEEEALDLSVASLAEALEITPDELLAQLKASTKVNGTSSEVALSDLITGYQKSASFDKNSQELAAQKKAFEAESGKAREEMAQQATQAHAMAEMLQNNLMSEYQNVDWQTIRQTDPAEYSALMTDFQQRQQQIGQIGAQVQQAQEIQRNEQQQKAIQQQQMALTAEKEALLNAIPEWQDEATAKTARNDMRDFLMGSYGFNENDVNNVMDHRLVLLVRDAMQAKAASSKAEIGQKKVKAAPKLIRPGVKQGKQTQQAQKAKDLRSKLRKSGSTEDVAALLFDRM